MDLLLTSALVGIGLSMDCFAVAIAAGSHLRTSRIRTALFLAFFFGAFQTGMTLAGFFLGTGFAGIVSAYDHWVAALLLFAVGAKMISEGVSAGGQGAVPDVLDFPIAVYLAVATSIDALAVGISFAFLDTPILVPAVIIGIVAAGITCTGVFLGGRLSRVLGRRADIAGGMILLSLGIRILLWPV